MLQPGEVATLIVAPLVALGLAGFLRYSSWGLGMRAMAENSDSARLSGVWVKRMSTLAWAIAGLLSTITAMLDAPGQASALKEALPPGLLLRALAAALIAGMTSLTVAFVAGIAIGIVEQVVNYNLVGDPNKTSLITFGLFALILVILLVRVRLLRRGPRDGGALDVEPGRGVGTNDRRSTPPLGRARWRHDDDRGRRAPPARALARALVPLGAGVHLRRDRALAHAADRVGGTGVARVSSDSSRLVRSSRRACPTGTSRSCCRSRASSPRSWRSSSGCRRCGSAASTSP